MLGLLHMPRPRPIVSIKVSNAQNLGEKAFQMSFSFEIPDWKCFLNADDGANFASLGISQEL